MMTNIIILVVGLLVISNRVNAIIIGVPVAAIAIVKLVVLLISFVSVPVAIIVGAFKKDKKKTIFISIAILLVIGVITYLILHFTLNNPTLSSKIVQEDRYSNSMTQEKPGSGAMPDQINTMERIDPTVEVINMFVANLIQALIVFSVPILAVCVTGFYLFKVNSIKLTIKVGITIAIIWIIATLIAVGSVFRGLIIG